jgi:hypothetical protein
MRNNNIKIKYFCNGDDNKVLAFDAGGNEILDFLKLSGLGPKLCAASGSSIIISHLGSGDLTETISSTGVIVLDRVYINSVKNVGIGINTLNAL